MAVSITGTRSTLLKTDQDGDGNADPGDVFITTLIIENDDDDNLDDDATGVEVETTENGLTVNPGTFKIGPIAMDDTLASITGNTPVTFNASQLTGNDIDSDDVTPTLKVVEINGTAVVDVNGDPIVVNNIPVTGGTVTSNANGTFTFTPTTGFTGNASFTYTIEDEQGLESVSTANTTPGTVTIPVNGLVWYVDSNAAGGGDGSYNNPFNSFVGLNGANGVGDSDGANDTIFVYNRGASYTTNLELEAGQKLFGDGHVFNVNGIAIDGNAGQTVLTNTSGIIITLATDNEIRGLDISMNGAGVTGLADDNASVTTLGGTFTMANASITGTGQAVDIDQGGNLNVSLTTLSAGNSNAGLEGVLLAGTAGSGTGLISGSFSATNGTIQNTGGQAFSVGNTGSVGGGTIAITYGGNIATAVNSSAVFIGARPAGAGNITFSGNITQSSAGSGIEIINVASGTIAFSGTKTINTTTGSQHAISVTGNSGAVINFTGGAIDIDTTSGHGFSIQQSGGQVNVSTAADIDTTSGRGISISGSTGGAVNFTGGNLTILTGAGTALFDNNASTGSSLTITGSGNTLGTTNGGQLVNIANVGTSGLTFDTLSSSASTNGTAVSINNLDGGTWTSNSIAVAGTTGAGADGINIQGGSSTTFNLGTVIMSNLNAVSDDAIELSGANGAVTITSVTLNNINDIGVEITNATNSVSINGGQIGNSNDTGREAVLVSGGSGDVTVAATLTKNTAGGNLIEVNGHTAGTVIFSGALSATGGHDNGILITGSGGTINFTNGSKVISTGVNNGVTISSNTAAINFQNGGLDIDTTSGTGFSAGSIATATGGSVTITGSNNSIVSTTGSSIVINGTTIGGGGVTLRDVSSNGGSAPGIYLKNAGSGGFTITGTGTTTSSGGVIASKTGADLSTTAGIGIYLESTNNISLSNMDFSGAIQNHAIRGVSVNNFTLRDSRAISSGAPNSNFGTSGAADEGVIFFTNLSGTALFEGNNLAGGFEDIILVENTTGTLNMTVQDTAANQAVIGLNGTTTGNDGILFDMGGSANGTLLVNGVTFSGSRGDMVQATATGAATMNVTLSNNTFHNLHPDIVSGGGGVSITAGAGTGSGPNVTYAITGNSFRGAEGTVIFVNGIGPSGTMSGTILNNTIGNNNGVHNDLQADTGANNGGSGIFIGLDKDDGTGTLTSAVRIEGNNIGDIVNGVAGIHILANGAANAAGTTRIEATIKNNTIDELGTQVGAGIYVQTGGDGSSDDSIVGLNIENNTITFNAGNSSIAALVFEDLAGNATFSFPGYGGPYTDAGLAAFHTGPEGNTITLAGTAVTVVTSPNGTFANGNAFVLPVPLLAAHQPGEDWESALLTQQLEWLAAQEAEATTQPVGDPIPVDDEEEETGSGGDDDGDGATPQPVGDPIPADEPHPVIVHDGVLSQAELDYLVEAAIQRWIAAGASDEQVAAMRATGFGVADMTGVYLAASTAGSVTVDSDGAGHGWFLDETPGDDAEFAGTGTALDATADGGAAGRMDLLTVIMHELGHQVGLEDLYQPDQADELMYGYANLGVRRVPGDDDLAGADPSHVGHTSYVLLTPSVGTIPADKAVQVTWESTVNNYSNQVIPNPFGNTATISGTNFADVNSNTENFSVDSRTIGNLVYIDVNANGTYDAGTDTPIPGVAVSLYADADDNGTPDGAAIATDITDASGLYSFANLADGKYIVALDAANFLSGGALEGLTSYPGGTDPDDNIDNDDNGVDGAGALAGAIVAGTITLTDDGEPDGVPGGAGDEDGDADPDTNLTVDFGFIQPNQEPTATNLNGDSVTWTEGGTAVTLDAGADATIADVDSPNFGGGSLTVAITAGGAADDVLDILASGSISITIGGGPNTVSFNGVQFGTWTGGGNGGAPLVFTFDDDATPAAVQALVRDIAYNNSSVNDPTDGNRTITWTLVDGDGTADGGDDTAVFTTTVDVDPVNDAPSGTDRTNGNGNPIVIPEDTPHTFAATDFGFSDPLDGNAFAFVVITTLPTNGTLELSGGAVSAGQAIAVGDIPNLTYTPDLNENGAPLDSFTFQVRDDGGTDDGGVNTDPTPNTIEFNVTAVNDAPIHTVPGNQNISEDAPITFTGGIVISVADVDAGAADLTTTVTIADGALTVGGVMAGLAVTGEGTNTLTLVGTLAEINDALDGLTYTPATNVNGSRTLTITTNDGGASGTDPGLTGDANSEEGTAQVLINLAAINDAPVLADVVVALADQSEDDLAPVGAVGTLVSDLVDLDSVVGGLDNVTDVDSANIGIALTGTDETDGVWWYSTDGGTTWNTVGAVSGASALLLEGDDRLYFVPDTGFTGTITSAITFRAWDQSGGTAGTKVNTVPNGGSTPYSSATDTASLTVVPDNIPPVAQPDAVATNENAVLNGDVFADNGSGVDEDPDANETLVVEEVNTSSADVDDEIVLPSGAKLKLNADGTFSYNPNGQFNYLISAAKAAATGAVNSSATDTFTYKLLGGNTVTVTVTINGVDGAGDQLRGDAGNNTINGTPAGDVFFIDQGGNDTLNGLGGNDQFYMDADLNAADRIDGGLGFDSVWLQGNITMTFDPLNFTSIERIGLLSADVGTFDYNLTTVDANVAAGAILVVNASFLEAGEDLTFNGLAETDGRFTILSGAGNDILIGGALDDDIHGGAGNDRIYGMAGADRITGGLGADLLWGGGGQDLFVINSAAESTGINFDTLDRFLAGTDKIDLPTAVTGWTGNIGSGQLDAGTFDADLAAAVDAALQANSAVLFTPDSGSFAGRTFAVIDADGDGAYQVGVDYVFEFLNPLAPVDSSAAYFV